MNAEFDDHKHLSSISMKHDIATVLFCTVFFILVVLEIVTLIISNKKAFFVFRFLVFNADVCVVNLLGLV